MDHILEQPVNLNGRLRVMNGQAVVRSPGIDDKPPYAAPHFMENFGKSFSGRRQLVILVHKTNIRLQVVPDNRSPVSVKKLPPDFADLPLLLNSVRVGKRFPGCK